MKGGVPGLLTALITVLVLFALAAYQATTATAGTRLLGRIGASLVELDRWLPGHEEDIRLLASDKPQTPVHLNDLPIDVSLPAAQVTGAEEPELRSTIVEVMGRTLYSEGTAAFRDDSGKTQSLPVDEPVRWTVSALDRHMHTFWKAALPLALLLLVAFGAGVLMGGSSPAMPMLFGTGFAAIVCLAGYAVLDAAGRVFSGAIDKEIVAVLRDCAWIGVRDSLAVLVIGGTLIFMMRMIDSQADHPRSRSSRPPSDSPAAWPE